MIRLYKCDLSTIDIESSMNNVWSRFPHLFQQPVIKNVLQHVVNDNAHGNLLVQRSGQGKSTVYQTIGNILRGVAVIIQPTLALSADQKSKIDFAKITDYAVVGIQCDSIKSTLASELLEKTLLNIDHSTTANIYLFVSPETLLKDQWIKLLMNLISNKVMRLLVVDEVHPFLTAVQNLLNSEAIIIKLVTYLRLSSVLLIDSLRK